MTLTRIKMDWYLLKISNNFCSILNKDKAKLIELSLMLNKSLRLTSCTKTTKIKA